MRLRERAVATVLTRSSSLRLFSARAKAPQCSRGQLCLPGQRLHGTWLGEEEKHIRTSIGEEGEDTREVRPRGDLSAINLDFNGCRDNGASPTQAADADGSTFRRVWSTAETTWKRRRFEPSSPSPSRSAATTGSFLENSGPGQFAPTAEETWRQRLSPSSLYSRLSGRGCKNSWEEESEGWLWRRRRAQGSVAADVNSAQIGRWHGAGCRCFFSVGIGGSDPRSVCPVNGADLRRLVGIILDSRRLPCRGHRCAAADAEAMMKKREEGKEGSPFRPSSFVKDFALFSRQAASDQFFAGRNSNKGVERERRKGHGFTSFNYWRGSSDDVADGLARSRRGGLSMICLLYTSRCVSRTSNRPLASGAVTVNQAVVFLGSQLLLGLGILLQLNQFSQILGASSLLLVGTYPLMKRYTYWPQAYLGLTINWGALLGWAAVRGSLDPFVVTPLYFSCLTWTVVYDTIYAHQDKFDDERVGVKSTALQFGEATPMWLTGFSGATIGGLICVGKIAGLGWGFYPALIAASSHLAWQTRTVDLTNRADCLAKFVSNKWFGGIVFAGTVLGNLTA
ncbi:hypothetical protein CBR_g5669 [Chara braunii]|uniref:Uncharacterized protein n=1 Tax=Chara braunii TaxID=69332 RepID=A0A388JRT2_CHABU|nr:hypothetical protein CBR_g5669 [Chara braunii]|eukprot:GBG60495.1 hypothetical protein CBR_g5669 [Chara braunii]